MSRVTTFKNLCIKSNSELTFEDYKSWFGEAGVLEEQVVYKCMIDQWLTTKNCFLLHHEFKNYWPADKQDVDTDE